MNNTLKQNNALGNTLSNNITKLNNKIQQQNKTNNKITNNKTNTSQLSGYSGSNVIGIILLVVVLIGVASASYWFYNYYTTKTFVNSIETEVIPDIRDAGSKTSLASSVIPSSSYSNEYSISFWVNIQDYNYNYGKEKVILRRGTAGSGNPEIILDAKKNDLIVRVKLQGQGNTNLSISKFEDIPIKLPSQNIGSGYIQPEDVPFSSNAENNSLNKVGSNDVDFPTIQYINNNGTCGYFDMISGNKVEDSKKLIEGFADVDDAIAASVKVIVDICNIAKTIQSQNFADDSVDTMNTVFQALIDALEKSRSSAKSLDDINKSFADLSKTMPINKSSTTLSEQFNVLQTDITNLAKFANVKIDYNDLVKAINTQMAATKCPITISGSSDIDTTISFYENMINLVKKTILTYINNMGSGIKKIYPELNAETASCMIDNSLNKDPTIGTCVAKMIPLQKWVSVIVSVYNQVVDIYIDGQLTSSCVLKGFPAISTDEVNITPDGGFSGKIARVMFSNTAMTVRNARNIYYSGPVASDGILSMVPNWVYWAILIIIIVAIGYSFLM